MISLVEVVSPAHAVVGSSDSSLALVPLPPHGTNASDLFSPRARFPQKCSVAPVLALSFNPTALALFASAQTTVLVWDVVKQAKLASCRLSSPDSALAGAWLLPTLAASAGSGCGVSFWDTRAGARKVHWVKVARDNLYFVARGENGVFCGGGDGVVHHVDVRNNLHEELRFGDFGAIVGMNTSAGGDQVVVVFETGDVRVAAKNALVVEFSGVGMAAKSRIGCAVDKEMVALGTEDGKVMVWKNGDRMESLEFGLLAVLGLEFCGDDIVAVDEHALGRWAKRT